ncbi:hypothetical protein OIU78_011467, partial [Salix suchowensis]
MMYSAFDTESYYVIPGSLLKYGSRYCKGIGFVAEQALVLKALLPLLQDFPLDSNSKSHLINHCFRGILLVTISAAVEATAVNLSYPRGTVKYFAADSDVSSALSAVDLV